NVWRQAAENVAESLQTGMRAIVNGRLRHRSVETREGEQRTVYEIEVDERGPALKSATARGTRASRAARRGGGLGGGQQGGGGFQSGGGQPQGGFGGGQGRGQQTDDPWGSAPQAGGSGGFGGSDEPPF